ncbi:MAG: tetratricopeptide repeat protein [Candidatus Melainabacteria bacterium]|nr:tetratricopeptide repeat protein [Candidatus Melainabacteria bacterium]
MTLQNGLPVFSLTQDKILRGNKAYKTVTTPGQSLLKRQLALLNNLTGVLLLVHLVAGFNLPVVAETASNFEHMRTTSNEQTQARQLFIEALLLLRENKAFAARQILERAAELEPDNAAIHCNLGLAYQNSGNVTQAMHEFANALKLKPNMPEATLNTAGCYQSIGKTQEAIEWYKKYVHNNPHAPETKQVKDIIKALEISLGKPGSDPSCADYFDSITGEGTYRWPSTSLPIKVFIDPAEDVEAFRESFHQALLESFDAWMLATQNRLAYVLVQEKSQANIICEWTSNPQEVSEANTQSERGMAHIYAKDGNIRHATVKILTRPMLDQGSVSDDDIKKACLHELGHVLGLQGHSTNNHDVMFFTVDTSTVWPVLSKRDKATIARLYEKYPKLADPTPPVVPPQ